MQTEGLVAFVMQEACTAGQRRSPTEHRCNPDPVCPLTATCGMPLPISRPALCFLHQIVRAKAALFTCSGSMCPPRLPCRASRSSSAWAGLSRLGRADAVAGGVGGASGAAPADASAAEERRADARAPLRPGGLEGGLPAGAAAAAPLPLAPLPLPLLPLLPLLSGMAWRASGWGAPRRLAAALRMLRGVGKRVGWVCSKRQCRCG